MMRRTQRLRASAIAFLTLIGLFLVLPRGVRSQSGSDFAIESVTFAGGRELSTGHIYSPTASNRALLDIRVRWNKIAPPRGIQCENKVAIIDSRGIMVVNPMSLPAPDDNGLISLNSIRMPIPSGLPVNFAYVFNVKLVSSHPSCDSNPANNTKRCSIRLLPLGSSENAGPDYAIESVTFRDGRPLSDGLPYDPSYRNPVDLRINISFNSIAGVGDCRSLGVSSFDRRGVSLMNPIQVTGWSYDPSPGTKIVRSFEGRMFVPSGLSAGQWFVFDLKFVPPPPVPRCDTNVANNVLHCAFPLLEMSGNDLTIRIVEVKRATMDPMGLVVSSGETSFKVTYEIANLTGTEFLPDVPVSVYVQRPSDPFVLGEEPKYLKWDYESYKLPPKKWERHEVHMYAFKNPSKKDVVVRAVINPHGTIREIRDNNNVDSKRVKY